MDLTESELFKDLLEIKNELFHIDLHNDYTCTQISYREDTLELKFKSDSGQGWVVSQFKDVTILRMEIPLQSLTIDNFHRGRYEVDGNLFDEYQGKKCFYIEFYEGGVLQLLCGRVLLQIQASNFN